MAIRRLFLAVPTALVAAAGLAWLTSAIAFDGGSNEMPQIAQAAPPATTPPVAGGGSDRKMEHHKHAFSPRNMCVEHAARRVGKRAYLKARLDLKPTQMQAWNSFEKAADEVSTKQQARCATLPTEMTNMPNFADRFTKREAFMKSRLDSVEAVKPSLLALYAELTPEQKAIMDRPMGHRGHGRHGRG